MNRQVTDGGLHLHHRYTPDLNRQVTHLIVAPANPSTGAPPDSKKAQLAYRNRFKWPTRLVTLQWLHHSCTAGRRAPEENYPAGVYSDQSLKPDVAVAHVGAEKGVASSRFAGSRPALAALQCAAPVGMAPVSPQATTTKVRACSMHRDHLRGTASSQSPDCTHHHHRCQTVEHVIESHSMEPRILLQ